MTIRSWLLILLIIDIASLALLGVFYLRKRRLPWAGYLFWGLIALIPVIGPFLVILSRPGDS
jgi:hypothetical protein